MKVMKLKTIATLNQIIRNQRGDALIMAMVILTTSIISSLVMIEFTRQVEENSKRPRAKSMMSATEAKVRQLLISPDTYACTAAAVDENRGRADCMWIPSIISSLSRAVMGAPCPSTIPNCGIKVTPVDFDPVFEATPGEFVSRAKVNIHYEGTDWTFKDVDIVMDIPADVLKATGVYQCPTATPKFNGFITTGPAADLGKANCSALPGLLPAGQYVRNVNMADLTITPQALPATVDCNPTSGPGGFPQMIGHVDWGTGGTVFNSSCVARMDPFVAYGFVPGATAGDPSYTPNTD